MSVSSFLIPIATMNDTTTINRLHPPKDAIRMNVAGKNEAIRQNDQNDHELLGLVSKLELQLFTECCKNFTSCSYCDVARIN